MNEQDTKVWEALSGKKVRCFTHNLMDKKEVLAISGILGNRRSIIRSVR